MQSAKLWGMKAMILAAGLGTRLRPLTNDIPKPMVPVAGVPNIERIILHLKQQGISEFAINLHYCPAPLKRFLGDGRRMAVEIVYFHERDILGTGGGIKNMFSQMGDAPFLVVNGDVLFMPPVPPLVRTHNERKALASMIIHRADNTSSERKIGTDDGGMVKRLKWGGDQSLEATYMFTGMHIINPELKSMLPDVGCIVNDTYISMVEKGMRLAGIVEQSCFRDLGTPADYLDANLGIASGDIPLPGGMTASDGSIVPDSVEFGQGAQVRRSVLGENVILKNDVQVNESVVMAGAVVKESIHRKIVLTDGTLMSVA